MKGKSFDTFTQVVEYIIKYFKGIVFVAIVLIAASGVYRVESNEVAVVLRFGRLVGDTPGEQVKEPGLHFAMPFFIDEVVKIPIQTVHEKEIITHYTGKGNKEYFFPGDIANNGYLLTGDNNIVLLRIMAKYRITNAARYALYINDSVEMINCIVSGEFTRFVAHMDLDYVLTSGKNELSSQIMKSSQAIFDELQTGITLTSLELTEVVPPAEVIQHFEMVITASVNKATRIQTAREQAATIISRAEFEARAFRQNSITNRAAKLTKARDEMAEFMGLYDQYVKNPHIIIDGTFRQRINTVLAQSGGSIIVAEGGDMPLLILP